MIRRRSDHCRPYAWWHPTPRHARDGSLPVGWLGASCENGPRGSNMCKRDRSMATGGQIRTCPRRPDDGAQRGKIVGERGRKSVVAMHDPPRPLQPSSVRLSNAYFTTTRAAFSSVVYFPHEPPLACSGRSAQTSLGRHLVAFALPAGEQDFHPVPARWPEARSESFNLSRMCPLQFLLGRVRILRLPIPPVCWPESSLSRRTAFALA